MNKTIITILSVIVVIIAVIIGFVMNKPKFENEKNLVNVGKVTDENIVDECTEEYDQMQNETLQEANSTEEKISPNCAITFKITYKKCGHTISKYEQITEELVNKTRKELEKKYNDWEVEKFSDTQIVLTKEEEGECKEHYVVKDNNGKVIIYKILEDGSQEEYEQTDISTQYLPQADINELKNGVRVNGKEELEQLIENFE